jgi:hypothetical protein
MVACNLEGDDEAEHGQSAREIHRKELCIEAEHYVDSGAEEKLCIAPSSRAQVVDGLRDKIAPIGD